VWGRKWLFCFCEQIWAGIDLLGFAAQASGVLTLDLDWGRIARGLHQATQKDRNIGDIALFEDFGVLSRVSFSTSYAK
jgi:hypothetical protein